MLGCFERDFRDFKNQVCNGVTIFNVLSQQFLPKTPF